MTADFVLEACVDSLESALSAKEGGATRLELCANLIIGGTTPSLSLLRRVKRETGLPVHVLLRPRFGDFLYTEEEFSMLLEEGAALLEQGADALVSGFLTPEGDLDQPRLEKLVTLCHGKGKNLPCTGLLMCAGTRSRLWSSVRRWGWIPFSLPDRKIPVWRACPC